MSGERKSIVINANSLLGSGGGGAGGGGARRQTKRRGERKIRPSSIVQPSTLKKTLLERIKQHQRTRERARDHHGDGDRDRDRGQPLTQDSNSHTNNVGDDNTFSQSIDFLRKLAMKRRQQQQQTQKQRGNVSTGTGTGVPEAKTPESKMLNQVAETLHNGEIITNTGLLGLPVVQMPQQTTDPFQSQVVAPPMISLGAMPMPMPMPMTHEVTVTQTQTPMPVPVPTPPNITELADMYNNTIANVSEQAPSTDTASASASASASELPLHIPNNPDDYLPSIFIKEEPPHGCLKNGKKPTFREWATKMLGFPSAEPAPSTGDGSSTSVAAGTAAAAASASDSINPITGMRVKIRKTKKKSYRIGKHDDVVGVLLKNKKDQNHIRTQHLALRQKTIGEIRKYLYDHHLLKIGSNAPPDVLRRMYEDSILTGDVKNTNNDVLLHNFMSGGGGE